MKWHLILIVLFYSIPAIAASQDIRRCVGSDGTIIFTDKSCTDGDSEIQAIQNTPIITPTKKTYPRPPSCNRSTDELLYSVRTAIDMRDANMLARHYHWAGISSPQAEHILNRLEFLASNPLTDIRLLQYSDALNTETVDEYDTNSDAPPTHKVQNKAYALKIVQYVPNAGIQQQSTVFKLQHYYDCYWIRF